MPSANIALLQMHARLHVHQQDYQKGYFAAVGVIGKVKPRRIKLQAHVVEVPTAREASNGLLHD